jgi:DNA polymerase III subunit beta
VKACGKTGKISVHLGGEHVAFSDGTRTLITRPVSGEFIRYQTRLDAGEYPTVVTADAAKLTAVVVRAGKVTGRGERVEFEVSGESITLAATRNGKTAGSQSVPVTFTGPPAATGFNPEFLVQVLSGITGQVRIELPASPTKPIRVTSDDGFTAILIPQRLAS